jgi:cytochrome c-type biogenesis protein CcmH
MKFKIIKLLSLIALLFFSTTLHALTTRDIEGQIMCICKDKCGKVLASCTCGTSDEYRKEINAMIAEGKTQKEIIDHYVERFGEKVLSSPTKEGFNLTAWIVPFLAIFAGGWGINKIVQSWVKKRKVKIDPKEGLAKAEDTEESPFKKLMEEELKELD